MVRAGWFSRSWHAVRWRTWRWRHRHLLRALGLYYYGICSRREVELFLRRGYLRYSELVRYGDRFQKTRVPADVVISLDDLDPMDPDERRELRYLLERVLTPDERAQSVVWRYACQDDGNDSL
jgi:hypothetical protein